MKKVLLIGCGAEIGSNILLLSKKNDFGFDIDTVLNSQIALDKNFPNLGQEHAIIARLRLAYPSEQNSIKISGKNKIKIYGKQTNLVFQNLNQFLSTFKVKNKWDAIILATSKNDLKDPSLLNKLLDYGKYVFGMAESDIMTNYYPALLGFNSKYLNSFDKKNNRLFALGSCQTNGWLAQFRVIISALAEIKSMKIQRVEVDIVHPDTPTGRIGTKSFSPREQDARNNLRPSFSQIDGAMKKILSEKQALHTVSLRVFNEEPGYQINRLFFNGKLSKSFLNDFENKIKICCEKSNGVSSFEQMPLGSKAFKYRKEIAHMLPQPYLKIYPNCFGKISNINEIISQAFISNVYGYCFNALRAIKNII